MTHPDQYHVEISRNERQSAAAAEFDTLFEHDHGIQYEYWSRSNSQLTAKLSQHVWNAQYASE